MKISVDEKGFFTKPLNILIIAIIANALWGSAFPAIKIGYELFRITEGSVADKIIFAGTRFIFAGLLVTLFNCLGNKRLVLPQKEDIKGIILLGLIQTTLEYVFFYISLTHISGVKGSIINSMGNFYAVLLAALFFKNDRMTLTKSVGCALGIAGVIICNLGGEINTGFSLMGEGFMLSAAFCFALGGVITKIFAQNTEPVLLTGYQLTLGGVILFLTGMLLGGRLNVYGVGCVLIMVYLAALSAIAFSLWAKLLKFNPVGKISLFGFLNPIFGVILSGIFLHENFLDVKLILALICVSVGIAVVNRAPLA